MRGNRTRVTARISGTLLALVAGQAFAQETLYTLDGDLAGDNLGISVSAVGDIDHDGYDDLVAGAYNADHGGGDAGLARVYSGKTGAPIFTFLGDSPDDSFGYWVAGAADVDNDGFPDVIIGAYLDDDNGIDSGSARVCSGKDGSILHTFHGDSAGDNLGAAVDGAGDVDGDGFADLVVGAFRDDNTGIDAGSVRIYSGKDGAILYTFHGDRRGDFLGFMVSGVGDVNNDGNDDVVAGAPMNDTHAIDAGSARVYSGSDGSVLYTFHGDSAGDNLGYPVGGAGDVNSDGHDDVIAGARLDDNNGTDSGSARVYSGKDGSVLYTIDGNSPADFFGYSVSGAGDVNSDGHDDVIIGAYRDDNNGIYSGSARVCSGKDGSTIYTVNGDAAHDRFGSSVGGGGDVNQDGVVDVIVGAPYDDNHGISSGMTRVHSGVPCGEVTPYQSGCAGSAGFTPELDLTGCSKAGQGVALEMTQGLGGSTAFLFLGTSPASIPLNGGCSLLVVPLPLTAAFPLSSGGPGAGGASIPITIPPATPSLTVYLQAFVVDGGVPQGFSNSAGLEVEVR